MPHLILQVQLLLAALSAFLPLIPGEQRARAGEMLDVAAKALAMGAGVGANIEGLAYKLAAVRAEVEAIAASGLPVSAEQMDAALTRVRTASAAFRAAVETAEAANTPS